MLSLDNKKSADELREFDTQVRKGLALSDEVDYVCEMKLDGLAVELVYVDGVLVNGSTLITSADRRPSIAW